MPMSNSTLHNGIIVNVFCEVYDLANAAKTKIVSTLVIMDPAMKPQY